MILTYINHYKKALLETLTMVVPCCSLKPKCLVVTISLVNGGKADNIQQPGWIWM